MGQARSDILFGEDGLYQSALKNLSSKSINASLISFEKKKAKVLFGNVLVKSPDDVVQLLTEPLSTYKGSMVL